MVSSRQITKVKNNTVYTARFCILSHICVRFQEKGVIVWSIGGIQMFSGCVQCLLLNVKSKHFTGTAAESGEEEGIISISHGCINAKIAFLYLVSDKTGTPRSDLIIIHIIPPKIRNICQLIRCDVFYFARICGSSGEGYQSLHITVYDNSSRSFMEVQLRTQKMDDNAEIGPANHLGYEKKQQDERARRDAIPEGECVYFDEAYERGMRLLQLELADMDVNMFSAVDNSLINDGCGMFRGRLILPYEHLSGFQNDVID